MKEFVFSVNGIPKPAGSKTAFAIKKGGVYTGRTVVMDACKKTKSWQATVKAEAKKHAPATPAVGPVGVELTFWLPRPKSHFGTGKNSNIRKASAPEWHTGKPDVLKLARAVEDAMTGIIYADDAQIIQEEISKGYSSGSSIGVDVRVIELKYYYES